jgi:hypothetical protein
MSFNQQFRLSEVNGGLACALAGRENYDRMDGLGSCAGMVHDEDFEQPLQQAVGTAPVCGAVPPHRGLV